MTLGQNITSAREAGGLDREQLAARVGVPADTLQRWEADREVPDEPSLRPLARQLGDFAGFYLVREAGPGSAQWLVKVTDTELVRTPVAEPVTGRRLVVGEDVLTKAPYTL